MQQNAMPMFRKITDLLKSSDTFVDANTATDDFYFYGFGAHSIPGPHTSPVHRTGFYSVIFAKDAIGRFLLNHHEVEIIPGSICFSNPGDIIQFRFEEIREVYMLILSESFLKENTHHTIMQEYPFLQSEGLPPFMLKHESVAEFEGLFQQIRMTGFPCSPLQKKQICYLFLLILLKTGEDFVSFHKVVSMSRRQNEIVREFKAMLQQHYKDLNNGNVERAFNASEYARAMCLHPSYLNNVIKEETGKPVSRWIIEKTISESKNLLDYSNLSVKEIAYRLGFVEAGYFSRYFKKYTKITATEYRESENNEYTTTKILKPVIPTQAITA